ncbi:MAG: aldo/keto reductase [Actinomycetota bacterium]|nr:aldo/keto reductase [Actinomycetota bacterium]
MRYLESDLRPRISKIGLGTWQFGSREWGYGDRYAHEESARIVERAFELGVTLFDTAEIYALGRSERILGRALAGRREQAFVATKIFPLLPTARVVEWRGRASVRRLGVERLDLYQLHWPNPVVRAGPTMRGMRALQARGLVGEVGVSNYSLARWRSAEAALGDRVLSNQVRYSLVDRRPERDLIPYAIRHGRLVIAYSPLAQGFLSARYEPGRLPANRMRRRSRLFGRESFARADALLRALREIAVAHDATPAQVALAWTIREPCVVAIPGASTVAQLEANAAAAELRLGAEDLNALDSASTAYAGLASLGRES